MKVFTLGEIRDAVRGRLISGDENTQVRGFAIDSRLVEEGNMFFATKGSRVDAHDYIPQVIERGCRAFVVSDETKVPQGENQQVGVILVEDTLKALQELAVYYLGTLPLIHKIGVTGSVGKTSTRDMIYHVCSTKYKTGRNKKNYNSAHGLPLSILDFEEDTQVAVLEMGMDGFGEIELLASMVRPDIAVITKIAAVNYEVLGNQENILKAKMEITTFFDNNCTLVVNSSCPMLSRDNVSGNYRLVTVGNEKEDDYIISNLRDSGDKGIEYNLYRNDKKYEIALPIPGGHNAYNASLAVAVGELVGIAPEEAQKGFENAALTGRRLLVHSVPGLKVIDDCYNACEDSIKSAINTLVATEGKRKVAILGDILGLAHYSEESHMSIGRYAAEQGVDLLIAIGEQAGFYAKGAMEIMERDKVRHYSSKWEFIKKIDETMEEGDVVLVKASRGMELEDVVSALLKDKE